MKSFHFHLNAGKNLYLNLETTASGWILLNRFIPDYLKVGYSSPLIAGEVFGVEADEFETDCKRMIYCFDDNNLNYRDSQHCFVVLNAVVGWHIKQYGRLIFNDLLTYVSEMCELMSAMGYSTPTLKVLYPNFVAACVGQHENHVKEALPGSMFGPPSLINFTGSARYQRLAEMCPKLTNIPTI